MHLQLASNSQVPVSESNVTFHPRKMVARILERHRVAKHQPQNDSRIRITPFKRIHHYTYVAHLI